MNEIEQLKQLFGKMEVVDLSHTLEVGIPVWPTHTAFAHNLVESYTKGDVACHYEVIMGEHNGTHMDAPLHFIEGGKSIAEVPLTSFNGRAATIQATNLGPNNLLQKNELIRWEVENGEIAANDIVLINFGWSVHWQSDQGRFLKDWPGLAEDAAQYLVEKNVRIVGTDVLAIDAFGSEENPAHYALLGNGVLIVENLNQLEKLPAFSFFQGFPLKIKNGSGCPIRAVAYIPK